MITEDYISFETAKLLKEKGFVVPYDSFRGVYINGEFLRRNPEQGYLHNMNDEIIDVCSIQMVMKWLRDVHKLYIVVRPYVTEEGFFSLFDIKSIKEKGIVVNLKTKTGFNTYEEACEAAIKYCLKNLIKNEDEEEESDIPVPKTVDEAISTLEKTLSDEDKEYLLKNGAISMHDSLGRWIRNEWGLWTNSELKNELKKKGFEHPDDMSNYIIEEFIKYWNNKI